MPEYLEKEAFKSWTKENITKNPMILMAIAYAPSADVELVRHGHWEADVCDRVSMSGKLENLICYKCSVCEMFSCQETKYCYNCGAKMDKEKRK
jgi:hypothetical protein